MSRYRLYKLLTDGWFQHDSAPGQLSGRKHTFHKGILSTWAPCICFGAGWDLRFPHAHRVPRPSLWYAVCVLGPCGGVFTASFVIKIDIEVFFNFISLIKKPTFKKILEFCTLITNQNDAAHCHLSISPSRGTITTAQTKRQCDPYAIGVQGLQMRPLVVNNLQIRPSRAARWVVRSCFTFLPL